jgi:hypothetical protein
VADPEKIYNSLHRGVFSDLETNESKLHALLQSHRAHSANTYHFERAFIDRVNAGLGSVIEKQGYRLL